METIPVASLLITLASCIVHNSSILLKTKVVGILKYGGFNNKQTQLYIKYIGRQHI